MFPVVAIALFTTSARAGRGPLIEIDDLIYFQAVEFHIVHDGDIRFIRSDPIPLSSVLESTSKPTVSDIWEALIENKSGRLSWRDDSKRFGKGLIGFGLAVDYVRSQENGESNPIATTMALDPADIPTGDIPVNRPNGADVDWKVTKEIERWGQIVILQYNAVARYLKRPELDPVTEKNILTWYYSLPTRNRCGLIGVLPGTDPTEYYYWGLTRHKDGYKVVSLTSSELISPERCQETDF